MKDYKECLKMMADTVKFLDKLAESFTDDDERREILAEVSTDISERLAPMVGQVAGSKMVDEALSD